MTSDHKAQEQQRLLRIGEKKKGWWNDIYSFPKSHAILACYTPLIPVCIPDPFPMIMIIFLPTTSNKEKKNVKTNVTRRADCAPSRTSLIRDPAVATPYVSLHSNTGSVYLVSYMGRGRAVVCMRLPYGVGQDGRRTDG